MAMLAREASVGGGAGTNRLRLRRGRPKAFPCLSAAGQRLFDILERMARQILGEFADDLALRLDG